MKTPQSKQTPSGGSDDRLVRLSLSFQPYEVEIIKEALNRMRYEKLSRCPWVKQDNGGYYYQPSKEVKRIQFVENSIKRQLSEPNADVDAQIPAPTKPESITD